MRVIIAAAALAAICSFALAQDDNPPVDLVTELTTGDYRLSIEPASTFRKSIGYDAFMIYNVGRKPIKIAG